MTRGGSAASEAAQSDPRRRLAALVLTSGIALAFLSGCAIKPAAPPPAPPSDSEATPVDPASDAIELYFRVDAFTREAVIEGTLNATRPTLTYTFVAVTNEKLHWTFSGQPDQLVLLDPRGDTDGPGFAEEVALKPGRYVLSVNANTATEQLYGPFRVELTIDRSQ